MCTFELLNELGFGVDSNFGARRRDEHFRMIHRVEMKTGYLTGLHLNGILGLYPECREFLGLHPPLDVVAMLQLAI